MNAQTLSTLHSRRWISVAIMALFVPMLLPIGCENMTAEQKAAWGAAGGALLGAAAGAAIDDNSGRGALIGAATGAAVGGLVGYGLGKYQERQIASREQLEREVAARQQAEYQAQLQANPTANITPPPETPLPSVEIEQLEVAPNTVTGGSEVAVSIVVNDLGPADVPPQGTIKLIKSNELLFEKEMKIQNNGGKNSIMQTISLPPDAASGPYTIVIEINHGVYRDAQTANFIVA